MEPARVLPFPGAAPRPTSLPYYAIPPPRHEWVVSSAAALQFWFDERVWACVATVPITIALADALFGLT